MEPNVKVIDSFLRAETYSRLVKFARGRAQYVDETNPVDGVVYPAIEKNVPLAIEGEVHRMAWPHMDERAYPNFMFLRLSVGGVHVPHRYHADHSMGRWSLMLYLSDPEREVSGTGFAQHRETGTYKAPEHEKALAATIRDQNDVSKWHLWKVAEMAQNRAVIFPAELFHIALPSGGFGKDKTDGRLVLTGFFS